MTGLLLRFFVQVRKRQIALFVIWLGFSFLINFIGQGWALWLYRQLALSPGEATFGLKPWQVASYAWLHSLSEPGHFFFNALGLFFLGPPLERRWGGRDFLKFYVWSTIIAGVFSVFVGLIAPGWFGGPVVGASGGVMAVLAAFSLTMPEAVILLFFVIPLQARYMIWLAVGLDLVFFLSGSGAGVAIHTHLGGVLGAWLLITGNWRPRLLLDRIRLFRLDRQRGRSARASRPDLRVIQRLRDEDGDDDDEPMLN